MLAELADHYQHRAPADSTWRGRKVVGYVGADTPLELIEAAAMLPIRVRGDPLGATDLAERYLGQAGDPVLRSHLNRLLDGSYALLDFLVIAHDSESMVALFQTLRELQRVEPVPDLPPFTFVDLLHLPYRTSQLYNREELRRFRDTLATWSGRTIDDAALRQAIAVRNEHRALLQRVAALRAADPPRLTGVEALQVIGAGMFMPVAEHTRLLRELLHQAHQLPARHGVRVFLTGSDHDHPELYALLEARGAIVVGEDHDWGNRAFADLVDESVDPIDALTDTYQFGAPASAKYGIAERAASTAEQAHAAHADLVLAWIRAGDDAPAWDVAHQRNALARYGIPLDVLADQPYGGIDASPLDGLLRSTATRR